MQKEIWDCDMLTNTDIVRTELLLWKQQITDNFMKSGQNTTGKTIGTLQVETTNNEISLTAWKYFPIVETGRESGKVPYNFQNIILNWMNAKGITADKPKSMAYFIARKIAKEGSLLNRQKGRKDIYSNVITEENINKVIEKISDNTFYNIYSEIVKEFKKADVEVKL